MAYSTGTATDVVDLVNKLATFIEANGWTRDDLSNEGTGRRYHAHRGAQYLNMRAYLNEDPSSEIVADDDPVFAAVTAAPATIAPRGVQFAEVNATSPPVRFVVPISRFSVDAFDPVVTGMCVIKSIARILNLKPGVNGVI